AQRP
ncbi:putative rTX toxin, partial [Vibrio parahaemolyticus VP2007-007]